MKFPGNISVRVRYLIIISTIIVISLISGTVFFHTMNTLSEFGKIERDFTSYFNEIYEIDHLVHQIKEKASDSTAQISEEIKELPAAFDQFYTHLTELQNNELITEDSAVLFSLQEMKRIVREFETELMDLLKRPSAVDSGKNMEDIHESFLLPVIILRDDVNELFSNLSIDKQRNFAINLFIVLLLSILAVTLVVSIHIIATNQDLRQLLDFVKKLEKGQGLAKLGLSSSIEFSEISKNLNRYLENRDDKINYLKTLGESASNTLYTPSPGDEIGNEIKRLAERLQLIQSEEKARQKKEKMQRWSAEGIAQFADIMRSEREDVKELSFLIIQKLVTYLEIEMGAIFLSTDTQEEPVLETIAAYAYDRRKYLNKTFRMGEGLPGTCALEKEKIYIDEVPEDYSDVISGVGQTKPRYVLLVPLKIESVLFGVLELATFRKLEEFELNFVDQLAESIASTLLAVKTNERTAVLLKQSQEQAEKLLQQEEVMKNNLKALEMAQEESRKKESEITGILNAMNESSLVAEFGLNGRFTHLNEKFLELLESPAEMILGKHHSEFSLVDSHTESYKQFWEELKNGEIKSIEEGFKMISGKEIWLRQTYTPIRNKEGRVHKILNIAVDITQAKIQQDSLKKQANEIIRQNLEMESLNEAVNSSIIKCELDHEGIILDTNKNYEILTGLNKKELLGRNYRLFLKDMEKEQFEKIWKEISKGKTYQGATRITKPTGDEAWLMSTFSPVMDESGKIYKFYLLALDITEKKLKYQLLEEANKEIERLKKLGS